MAQNFYSQGAPTETGLVRTYVANTQNNTDTLRSNFSGSAFPDVAVSGQHCYRTDEEKEYRYNGTTWVEVTEGSALAADIANASGSMHSLTDRLNVALNADGTLKNPIAAEIDEWKDTAIGVTYVSDNQFSVEGDLTPIFTRGRSVKVYNLNRSNGMISVAGVTTIVSSIVSDNNTIVTVANAIITSDLYDVKYGLIQESMMPQRNSLQRLTVYEVDDIAYTDKIKSNMYLSCIKSGTTGASEPLFKTIITPASVGEAHSVTTITTNGGTTGTVTSGGTFTGASNETVYVKLSTSTPGTSESYNTINLSYCVGSQTGTYTEIGLADGEPQEVVDGVTVQLGITGVYEDGEIYSIACIAEVSEPIVEKDTVQDGTVTWEVRTIGSGAGGDGVPLGTIIPFSSSSNIPEGYLKCNGAAVSRAMYPDLFDLIGTTYGSGDGSTTFNLPNYSFIGDTEAHVFGNGKNLAFTDGSILFGPRTSSTSAVAYTTSAYGKDVGTALTSGTGLTSGKVAGVATKALLGNTPENSGLTAELPTDSNTIYLIKAFNGQTEDSALIDITQYAQDLADLNHAVDNIKANYARVVSFDATTATLTLATP